MIFKTRSQDSRPSSVCYQSHYVTNAFRLLALSGLTIAALVGTLPAKVTNAFRLFALSGPRAHRAAQPKDRGHQCLSALCSLRTEKEGKGSACVVRGVTNAFRLFALSGPRPALLRFLNRNSPSPMPFGSLLSQDFCKSEKEGKGSAWSPMPFGSLLSQDLPQRRRCPIPKGHVTNAFRLFALSGPQAAAGGSVSGTVPSPMPFGSLLSQDDGRCQA